MSKFPELDEIWLISLPENTLIFKSWSTICQPIQKLCSAFTLVPPEFNYGNLDDAIIYSEYSERIVANLEAIITKLVDNINLLKNEGEETANDLLVNGTSVSGYVTKFQWDFIKYPPRKSPTTILNEVEEQSSMISETMNKKINEYNKLKHEVDQIEAKHTGSLLTRDLNDIIKKDDILVESKFLQNLILLVPSIDLENWRNYYEHLWHGIVPGSSKLLYEDHNFGLFTVVVTKSTVDDFKALLLKSRIIVRKYEYNQKEIDITRNKENKKKMQITKNQSDLQLWLKTHYSLCFSMYFHIQLMSVVNESILKYGVHSIFTIALIKPTNKYKEKVREMLNSLCQFSEINMREEKSNNQNINQYAYGGKEYYPYVNCYVYSTGTPVKTKMHFLEAIKK